MLRSTDALPPLLVFVHPSSERTLEPVRQDGSFAEKQQSHPALLFLVQGERGEGAARALAVSRRQAFGLARPEPAPRHAALSS